MACQLCLVPRYHNEGKEPLSFERQFSTCFLKESSSWIRIFKLTNLKLSTNLSLVAKRKIPGGLDRSADFPTYCMSQGNQLADQVTGEDNGDKVANKEWHYIESHFRAGRQTRGTFGIAVFCWVLWARSPCHSPFNFTCNAISTLKLESYRSLLVSFQFRKEKVKKHSSSKLRWNRHQDFRLGQPPLPPPGASQQPIIVLDNTNVERLLTWPSGNATFF